MTSKDEMMRSRSELVRSRSAAVSFYRSLIADKDHVFLTWENIYFTVPYKRETPKIKPV